MLKMGGDMSCATYYLEQPHILTEALASGLRMLWDVDIQDCTRKRDLDELF